MNIEIQFQYFNEDGEIYALHKRKRCYTENKVSYLETFECEVVRTLSSGNLIVRTVKKMPSQADKARIEKVSLNALIKEGDVEGLKAMALKGFIGVVNHTNKVSIHVDTVEFGFMIDVFHGIPASEQVSDRMIVSALVYETWRALGSTAPKDRGGYSGGSYCSVLGEDD